MSEYSQIPESEDPILREMQFAYDPKTGRHSQIVLPAPLSVCYSITDRCDRKCEHCMSASDTLSNVGLPTGQVKKLFEILKEAGVLRVDIVGGEPFLRKDIIDLVQHAVKLQLEVTITTHGGRITDEHTEMLAPLGVLVQVSLDGPREVNDQLRGLHSYNNAVNALQLLVKKTSSNAYKLHGTTEKFECVARCS